MITYAVKIKGTSFGKYEYLSGKFNIQLDTTRHKANRTETF